MSGQNFVSGGYQGGEREAHIEVTPVRKRVVDWLLQRIQAPPIPFLGPPCPPLWRLTSAWAAHRGQLLLLLGFLPV